MPYRSQTFLEEIFNTFTHAFGALLCAFLLGTLTHSVTNSPSLSVKLGTWVFGLSSILVYISSSLYHAVSQASVKRRLKVLDHIAIYFLIAGTYIPLILNTILPVDPLLGWSFIIFQLSAVILGILYKICSEHNYGYISTITYCVLGWSVIFIIKPIINNLSPEALHWLISGGIAFSVGVPFYVLKQYKWTHVVWHVFVLLGTIFHYLMLFSLCSNC